MLEKMTRKGKLAQNQDGSLVIVDEENKGHKIDNTVAAVWSKCDNKTIDEVTDDLSKNVKDVDRDTVKRAVEQIVVDLKRVNLLA